MSLLLDPWKQVPFSFMYSYEDEKVFTLCKTKLKLGFSAGFVSFWRKESEEKYRHRQGWLSNSLHLVRKYARNVMTRNDSVGFGVPGSGLFWMVDYGSTRNEWKSNIRYRINSIYGNNVGSITFNASRVTNALAKEAKKYPSVLKQ